MKLKNFALTMIALCSFSVFAVDQQETTVVVGPKFTATWNCTSTDGSANNAILCSKGAAISDALEQCRSIPCQYCAINSIHSEITYPGNPTKVAESKATIQGLNCQN